MASTPPRVPAQRNQPLDHGLADGSPAAMSSASSNSRRSSSHWQSSPSPQLRQRPSSDPEQPQRRSQLENDEKPHGFKPNLLLSESLRDELEKYDENDNNDDDSIDFLLDNRREMTLGRRLALILRPYRWYYPAFKDRDPRQSFYFKEETHRDILSRRGAAVAYPFTYSKEEKPSLSKAWAYFEHVALPRYVVDPECHGLDSAEPGEKHLPTRLYNPFCTPHRQLGDWGIGIGLYFTTLRALGILTFFAGLLSLPNILYFASDDYSEGQDGVRTVVRGSAICSNTSWVPCTTCTLNDFPEGRVGVGVNQETGETAIFAVRNFCDGATIEQGFINLAVLGLIILGLVIMNVRAKRMEIHFDEDEQTAQDYTVEIKNPPADAYDPEEWRTFFFENFDGASVTACTVGVDNDLLVASLVERREKLKLIEMTVEPGTSLDTLTLASLAAKEEKDRRFFGRLLAKFHPSIPEWVARVVVLTSKVQGLAQQSAPVTNVFVTFETEADQRKVLDALINHDMPGKAKVLFRGEHLLHAKEPDEPSTIRWQDLNVTVGDKLKQQSITALTSLLIIIAVAFIVRIANDVNVIFSAFAISIFNVLFPPFAHFITEFESHESEGKKQRSLYFKIALFRWINTAVVITLITPFTKTLTEEDGLIPQIYALFFSEIVTINAIQLGDIGGHIQRHWFAPRSKTQDAMNLSMQGSSMSLAERYTSVTKIFLLALWYSSIFPASFFLCSIAMIVSYFVDRFSLMRTWQRVPHLGPRISRFSRHYFFPIAAAAMALVSSYYWASFPFDNLCQGEDGSTAGDARSGTFVITPKDDDTNNANGDVTVTVNTTDPTFVFCKQDFLRFYSDERNRFPFHHRNQPEGREWMTDDQETVTSVWGWVGLASAVAIICAILASIVRKWCWRTGYRPRGKDQGVNFSDVATISCYVPQVKSRVFAYPLVACHTDRIEETLYDWRDPERSYSYYDITKDAKFLLHGTDVEESIVFSQFAHWPPTTSPKPSPSEAPRGIEQDEG